MLVHPSAIDLSTVHVRHLSQVLDSRRREIGSRWRRLTPQRQALPALAHLRCGDTYAQLAAGFGIGIATVYRYVREAIDVLAALAPTLDEAMGTAHMKAYVILDGTVLFSPGSFGPTPPSCFGPTFELCGGTVREGCGKNGLFWPHPRSGDVSTVSWGGVVQVRAVVRGGR